MITASIRFVSGVEFVVSAVYASNFRRDRTLLWNEIATQSHSVSSPDMPWVFLGDFNQTFSMQDHSNAESFRGSHSGMMEFQNLVSNCDLTELDYFGPRFTWWNHCPENPIGKKIDWVLVNEAWKNTFPFARASFEANGISDHLRSVVRIFPYESRKQPRFQFFNFLTQAPGFKEVISTYWNSTEPLFISRMALHRFHKKLKGLKPLLRNLNRELYGGISNRTRNAFDNLCKAQENALTNPCSMTFEEEHRANEQWNHLAGIEEQFFQQKSRISWLKNGDHNTAMFHRSVQAKAMRNRISCISTDDGDVLTESSDINNAAQEFFHNTLNGNLEQSNLDFSDILCYKCPQSMAGILTSPISSAEIKLTLCSMPTNKTPGPDGFTSEFFLAAWDVIGADFTTAVKAYFSNGFMPKAINSTMLVLVPKSANALSFRDYRPIACCNTIYKVISKILANRIKKILPEAIERNQCAFIKGRMLMENVLLATELVKNYHRGAGSSRSVLKLDISKAFDSVQWDAIFAGLRAMNIPEQFIAWVHGCISTPAYSISLNGELNGFFTSNRGLRQGCALSPYLFVIVLNILSCQLNKAALEGKIGYHPKCKKINLNHLCFADDLMIFSNGSAASIEGTMTVLEAFARDTGLHINPTKSSIYLGGLVQLDAVSLITRLGIPEKCLPIKYLGLPLTSKSMTPLDYEPLVDSIRNRMLAWENRKLSFAGRLQLIQAVVKSVINFWSSVFRLPVKCLKTIDGLCSAFLWSGSPNVTSKSKVSWHEVCTRKVAGGLGVRQLKDSAIVSSLSLVWRLVSKTESLWVAWINEYVLKGMSFWKAKTSTCGSWIWNKLLKIRTIAKSFVSHKVNSGQSTSFWDDNWTGRGRIIEITGEEGVRQLGVSRHSKVNEVVTNRGWCFRRCRDTTLRNLIEEINRLPLPDPNLGPDVTNWNHGAAGPKPYFSARQTWDLICPLSTRVPWHNVVWCGQGIPRHAFVSWLAIKNRLATGDRARRWGQVISCALCGECNETRDHPFFACPYSFMVWTSVVAGITKRLSPDWETTLRDLSGRRYSKVDSCLYRLMFQGSIYHIWRERNNRRHQVQCKLVRTLTSSIKQDVTNRLSTLSGDFAQALKLRWASLMGGKKDIRLWFRN